MDWDIVTLKKLGGYRLRLTFGNGKEGVVDLKGYASKGGVFRRFDDPEYVGLAFVRNGVLCWPDDVDIAPETIYSMATGEPLPEWMER